MSDGLSVIRRVAAGTPDGSPEAAVLAQSLAALDRLPRYVPDDSVVERIQARAASASDLDTLAAVRGAVGLGPAVASVEGAILAQSVQALESLPAYEPAPERVAASEQEAERASLAAVRAAVEADPALTTPEAELLRQSVEALGALPSYSPSDDALAVVLARAAEASVHPVLAAYGEADGVRTAEVALLDQSRQALYSLPTYAPSGEAVAAVLAAAAARAPAPSGRPSRRADDRAARPAAQPRRRTGVWAGVATLAIAVIAVVALFQLSPQSPALEQVAVATPPARTLAPSPQDDVEPEASGGGPLVASVPETEVFQRTAPRGPAADDFVPVVESRPAPQPVASAALADATSDAETAPEWDAGEDVRLLSLRLRQLREQNAGIEWDEPAVAFGSADPSASRTSAGFQTVREGAPAGAARIRTVPSDTTSRR